MLWALWAAKEAAYKAAVKACRGIPSAPRGYEVEIHAGGREGWLSGCVKTPAGIAGVCLHLGTDYVHCLGGFFSDGSLDSVLWTVEEMDAESAQEPGYESVFVRTIAGRYLSSVIGTDASAISVISRDEASIPSLRIGGRESSIDISLSHDGRFAAAAFMM